MLALSAIPKSTWDNLMAIALACAALFCAALPYSPTTPVRGSGSSWLLATVFFFLDPLTDLIFFGEDLLTV